MRVVERRDLVGQVAAFEADEARRFDGLNREHLDAHLRSIRIYAMYFPVIEVLTSVALAGLLIALCWIWAGRIMALPEEQRVFDA